MKLKKEYIVLGVLIIGLSLYLKFYSADKTHYQLPVLPEISQKHITKIVVAGKKNSVELDKKNDGWRIEPQGYAADKEKVEAMLSAIGGMRLTALISESGNEERYELGDDKKIEVSVFEGGTLKRKFDVGKAADSRMHTFVRLDGNQGVYHASGNFKDTFSLNMDALRDKTVLTVPREKINEMTIAYEGKQTALRLQQPAPKPPEKSGTKEPAPAAAPVWVDETNAAKDTSLMNDILTQTAAVKCESFMNGKKKEDFTNPIMTFTLKADKPYELKVFAKTGSGENDYPALTSDSDYPFMLAEWKVAGLKTKLETLLKLPEKKPETPVKEEKKK